MRTFNVIDANDKKVGEVKARSFTDAFFKVDKKFGEKTAIECRLEQRRESGQLDLLVIRTEVRKDDNGDVDELLLYINDRCVFHLETMSEQAIWLAMYPEKDVDEHFWINSKNGRSHIQIKEN